ncbi:acyl-CoA dehydrogenase family protein [Deinococcus geothermalis]|uniref:Acyl-CoA dehydrogenase, type 2-like protein n=1 Tax=Deinococcus geothermalis (strain DSM 11300 / CIP 105573 / AG-3a) TaxID=319795 RepID=Q1IZ07_DEIGD|nr:acyl-CoA dehydrogenase family protein [Deinococcus geothermalis]ABF45527.1 Acyl-CoA dehydrogenase, type 2-like protein [Deinococcus geothermalis DSM 11300]
MTPDLSPIRLSPELQAVTDRASQAIRAHAAACEAAQDVTPEAAAALRASGYTCLTLPQAAGGLGASLAEFAAAQLVLGEADAALGLVLAMHGHVIGAAFQGRTLPEPLLAALARASVAGELVNSLASEPELGSPSRGGLPRTTAVLEGDSWRVTGRKTWSTGARALGFALVTAATPAGEVARLLVPMNAPGVTVEPTWTEALALRGSGSHDVCFQDVAVPVDHCAPPTPGHPASNAWFWTAIAATYLGVGFAALHALAAYARERVPTALGAPIATLPRVQENVGRIAAELRAARALLFEAARAWDAAPGADVVPSLAAAKACATNAAVNATDRAVRTAGGAALTPALPLSRLLRDARAGLTHPPADEVAYGSLGAQLLGMEAGR